jgi:hypothetical protein
VLRVLERHGDSDPAIAAFSQGLMEAAEGFIETYDALRLLGIKLDREMIEGKEKVDVLSTKLASYVTVVDTMGAIEGFDREEFDASPNVPDDVISDAVSFLDAIQAQMELDPESVPNGQAITDDLTVALEEAQVEWKEADGVKNEHRAILEQNRENARALSSLLVGFRRVLGRSLGRSHPDYQTLRAAKIDRDVLEDGEEEGLPEHLVPAGEGEVESEGGNESENDDTDMAEAG